MRNVDSHLQQRRFVHKRFRELFGALLVTIQARGSGMFWTTWTMHHAGGDGLIKEGISFRIRNLSRDYRVDCCSIMGSIIVVKENEDMAMRKSTLLEFNGVNMGNSFSQDPIFYKLLQYHIQLLFKDPCHNIRTIACSLPCSRLIRIIS